MTEKLELKIPPPAIFATAVVFMWLTSLYTPAWGWLAAAPLRWLLIAVLLAAGLFFGLGGVWAMRQSQTTLSPLTPEQATALTENGVFRLTRNPMYRALALGLLAWAVYLASPASLWGLLCFGLYLTRFQIQPEERVLQQLFGEQYAAYCRRVSRW